LTDMIVSKYRNAARVTPLEPFNCKP